MEGPEGIYNRGGVLGDSGSDPGMWKLKPQGAARVQEEKARIPGSLAK